MPRRAHQISILSLEGLKELECAEKGRTRPPRGDSPPMCVFVMSKETLLPAQEDLGSKALETWKLEPFFFVLHSSGKELALERSAGGT